MMTEMGCEVKRARTEGLLLPNQKPEVVVERQDGFTEF